jgi:hypothetical protein
MTKTFIDKQEALAKIFNAEERCIREGNMQEEDIYKIYFNGKENGLYKAAEILKNIKEYTIEVKDES